MKPGWKLWRWWFWAYRSAVGGWCITVCGWQLHVEVIGRYGHPEVAMPKALDLNDGYFVFRAPDGLR